MDKNYGEDNKLIYHLLLYWRCNTKNKVNHTRNKKYNQNVRIERFYHKYLDFAKCTKLIKIYDWMNIKLLNLAG